MCLSWEIVKNVEINFHKILSVYTFWYKSSINTFLGFSPVFLFIHFHVCLRLLIRNSTVMKTSSFLISSPFRQRIVLLDLSFSSQQILLCFGYECLLHKTKPLPVGRLYHRLTPQSHRSLFLERSKTPNNITGFERVGTPEWMRVQPLSSIVRFTVRD